MNSLCFKLCIAMLLLPASTAAMAQDCKGLQDLPAHLAKLAAQTTENGPAQSDCGSLASVFSRLASTRKVGGRKLEEDRPFNAQAAQSDLASAEADPEVRPRLEKIRKEVTDPTQRLVYEAAVLDEEGYYGARDLRINQIKQQLK
ncbi:MULTISPECIES: hypothetical protein [unclassified Pseudomonas]|uniref:hypothetical protein n=1 Tax=unclassified Pseudomonas TaxID=196821 RepID=UPI00061F7D8C|nr:hypothetical protein [Pseudomonas sp. 10-1B]KIY42253.1 hypothetical protein TZ03_02965 [Pseudomonas sp. 10-1B]